MKTRKEQIDEMANIIKADYKQWLDITGVFPEGSSYYFECLGGGEDCAELLYNAGYGDISEYKAEIERLRTTLGQCNTELNSALESLRSQCREIGALKAGTKQAQIDVLNELKKKTHNYYPSIDSYCVSQHVVLVRDIDELIKEVQDE